MLNIQLLIKNKKDLPERTVYYFNVKDTNSRSIEDLKIKLLNTIGYKSTTQIKSELYILKNVDENSANYKLEVYD